MLDIDALDFAKGGGYVTVVCQDAATRQVLMVARADREALERTLATGEMHYHSRARGLWHKGATSGNVQRVVSLAPDCDGDAVLARVQPAGPACHTGAVSCFAETGDGRRETGGGGRLEEGEGPARDGSRGGPPPKTESTAHLGLLPHHSIPAGTIPSREGERDATLDHALARLAATIAERAAALPLPDGSTPSYTQRLLTNRNLRLKKLGEEASELAVACADGDRERAAEEGGDLIYHTLVALAAVGVSAHDLARVLASRAR